jgi:hypothetical protein
MREFVRDKWGFLVVAILGAIWVVVAILEV